MGSPANCVECMVEGTLLCSQHGESSDWGRGLPPDHWARRLVRVLRRPRPAGPKGSWPKGMVRPVTRRQPPRDTGTPPRAAP